ncbi:hypothetical protein BGZ63DRAFT_382337 [Mariannaea sp. PMI_226]|nr:hypothetical protein BGZ63DRAFT_382337 [Mariannaea sp. PMI_226]
MASSNSVPSRTAVNALRGVLLTTSCSVILLAEERRQRLKIARAAYDNAKKLHTARANRSSVALSESFGRRESYSPELGSFPTTANTQNPIRRRRRKSQLSDSELTPESVESLPCSQQSQSQSQPQAFLQVENSNAPQKNWDEWDSARKELSRLYTLSPFAHSDLFLRISTDELPIAPSLVPQRHRTQTQSDRMSPTSQFTTQPTSSQTASNADVQNSAIESPISRQNTKASALLRAVFKGENIEHAAQSFDRASVAVSSSLLSEGTTLTSTSSSLQESLLALDQLIAELEGSCEIDRALLVKRQESAIHSLNGLIASQSLDPKLALARGLRILEFVVQSQAHANIPTILDVLHPVCDEVCLLAVPSMDLLYQQRDIEGTQLLLKHLSQSSAWKSEETPFNLRNPWITRMLMHYWRKTHNFSEIKGIYHLLQDAGLFSNGSLSVVTQYAIRRRIALIALDAGDDSAAKVEMTQLRLLRPKTAEHDVKLRGRFLIRDASLGQWKSVWPQLEELKASAKDRSKMGGHYQNVLSWLTKIYCKDHSSEEIDLFVRDLVSVYGMTLSQTLAFLVLDRHGRNRDLKLLIQWLQFCHDGGLEMNQIFLNEIVDKCCKYWNLARVDVLQMLKGVKAFMPQVYDPHIAKYSVRGALNELHKFLPGERSQEDNPRVVFQLPHATGDSATLFERTAFRCMNSWAQKGDWQQVYGTFKEASEKGVEFSSRCLRLAVIANINLEGPHSPTASELVSRAHIGGHDVSGALVPLLVARLESGDNVGNVLQEAFSQGSRIHDSVYNKAARILIQKGFQEGAIRVCELAAEQNGNGLLAYSQFNFASLIFAYTGQRRYADLEALLTSFTSRSEWWQGSKECKESLKRAMKAVAQRVGRAPLTERDMHKSALDSLNEGLQHVKALRATVREDRQTLTQEVISVFKEVDNVHEGSVLPSAEEDQSETRVRNIRMTWEASNPESRDRQQPEESVYQTKNGGARVKTDVLQNISWEKSRDTGLSSEQEDIFVARQSLAGAFL